MQARTMILRERVWQKCCERVHMAVDCNIECTCSPSVALTSEVGSMFESEQ